MGIIGGTNYTFDSNDCALMFKKFRSLYGQYLVPARIK